MSPSMSGSSPLKLLGRALGAVHLAAGAIPLLFLGVALFQAARFGFEAPPERYGRVLFNRVAGTEAIVQSILGSARKYNYPPERIRVGIWGLADRPGGLVHEEALGVYIARALRQAGIRVRAHDPHRQAAARALFGGEVEVVADPLAAAACNILILACEEAEYAGVDWQAVAQAMYRPKTVFDCRSFLDGDAARRAGLMYVNMGNPRYQLWQDPDLEPWLAEVRMATKKDSRILFVPTKLLDPQAPQPPTASPRSRYFLAINYMLLPRQLYFYRPVLASGTVAQYQAWVEALRQRGPLQDDERRASIRDTGADHLVAFLIDQDFRAGDWSLGRVGVSHGRAPGQPPEGAPAGAEEGQR